MATAFIGLGVLLGYAAESVNLNPARRASAGQPAPNAPTDHPAAPAERPAACCDGVNKAGLQTVVNHNAAVAARAQQSGKKPNIVYFLADNLGFGELGCYGGGSTGLCPKETLNEADLTECSPDMDRWAESTIISPGIARQ
jgi:hypothetical protein